MGPVRGRLVLVPNTLDLGSGSETPLDSTLPLLAIQRAAGLRHWVVENAKSARAFLKRVHAHTPLVLPLQALSIQELPRPAKGRPFAPLGRGPSPAGSSPPSPWQALLAPALAGGDIGLLSEAGLPAVADPGTELVAAAHELGLRVEPHSGPSSLMLALAASGLGGQHFAFVGYLPVPSDERAQRIRDLETHSRRLGQTQLAIETPYRNEALMTALLQHLQPGTRLSVACGLSLPEGWSRTQRVADWRRDPPRFDGHQPAVFLWLG